MQQTITSTQQVYSGRPTATKPDSTLISCSHGHSLLHAISWLLIAVRILKVLKRKHGNGHKEKKQ